MDDSLSCPSVASLLTYADSAAFEVLDAPRCYVPTHWHEALTLLLVQRGELSGCVEEQSVQLSAGQCVCISPYALHSFASQGAVSALTLRISLPEALQSRHFGEEAETPETRRALERIRCLLLQMRDCAPSPFSDIHRTSLLLEIVYLLCESLSRPMTETEIRTMRNRQRLAPVVAYTQAYLQTELSLHDAATTLPMHPNAFCRFFRENTGMTYLNYVSECRLSSVYADVVATDTPLRDLLEQHGFTNYKLFRRLFSQRFHTTPGRLRSELRGASE